MPTTAPISTVPTASEVRSAFLRFFEARQHSFVPSSTTCPTNDPSLRDTFANAGMNQYKPIFQGTLDPTSSLSGIKRATNTQKCIRAGGKHNDLDDVGRDTYHHTFFEMLGNWSFGDYFKAETVAWAWELMTGKKSRGCYGLDPSRLYATYFGGDKSAGLEPDLEAKEIWETFLPPERVMPFGMKDNFWEMGDTGPCGPCSELHYDRVGNRDAGALVNMDDPEVIELWNLVFIQYDRLEGGKLTKLPAQHVDTGMGLERIVSVLQNKDSNYDTDVFTPIFDRLRELTGCAQYHGKLGDDDTTGVDEAYRVIADHIRTLVFAITDGGTPSNEGRGYVLRRILRRAVRYGRQKLNAPERFLADLAPTVIERMGEAFPELLDNPQRVIGIIREEETSFGKTLDRGIKQFESLAEGAKSIAGDDAFMLYDTYGFPVDLTQIMAEERGLKVDLEGFDRAMEEAKERSRSGGRKDDGGTKIELRAEQIAKLNHLNIKPTDDSAKFAGKDLRATVKAIWNGHNFDDHADSTIAGMKPVGIVLDKTNFYAEMGGQVADTGEIQVTGSNPGVFKVEDTKAFGGYVVHIGRVPRGKIRVGDDVMLHVQPKTRRLVEANHTTTHILNFALREVLGGGCDQRGSRVDHEKLRFDFAHNEPISATDLEKIEQIVAHQIDQDLGVYSELAPLEQAKQISSLRAVFDETYPDPVRVVSIGVEVAQLLHDPKSEAWNSVSVEFCGGTHLTSTKDAQSFALINEEGIAKGIRRMTALTGQLAIDAHEAAEKLEAKAVDLTHVPPAELEARYQEVYARVDEVVIPAVRKHGIRVYLTKVQDHIKAAKKQAANARAAEAQSLATGLAKSAAESDDPIVIATLELGSDRSAMAAAMSTIQSECPTKPIMLLSPDSESGRVGLLASVPKEMIAKGLKAGDWIRETAGIMGGKGGGKPDSAQGSGSDGSKLNQAAEHAKAFAHSKVQ